MIAIIFMLVWLSGCDSKDYYTEIFRNGAKCGWNLKYVGYAENEAVEKCVEFFER